MTNKKVYWLMAGVNIFIAIAIVGAVIVGDSLLKKQSESIKSQKLENSVLEKEQIALVQAKQDLEKYSDLQKISKQIVPQDKDQALTTRQIITLADKSGIKIGSLGFPASNLGTIIAKKTEDSSSTPTTTIDISQAKPVSGIKGLLSLDIAVISDTTRPSSYAKVISFLESLENNRRTAQVSQISIQPDSRDSSLLSFSLTLTVYIKP